jgi:hypothetical protein
MNDTRGAGYSLELRSPAAVDGKLPILQEYLDPKGVSPSFCSQDGIGPRGDCEGRLRLDYQILQ